MLRKIAVIFAVILSLSSFAVCSQSRAEDGCQAGVKPGDGYSDISVSVSCESHEGGSSSVGLQVGDSSDSGQAPVCTLMGKVIPCTEGEFWWSSGLDMYCMSMDAPADSTFWGDHRDEQGNPIGALYLCHYYHTVGPEGPYVMWMGTPDSQPSVDPAALVRTAVTSLGLHAPTVGIGAYVYPGYEDWGLSWWVGAPMWLWVNSADDLQWGTHTISAAQDGVSVTATVTSTKTVFDPGDGSRPVLCRVPGTPRPWSGDDLMRNHSPSGCEFTYLETNTMGDRNSRFTVSATTTWLVAWSASDGRSGTFTIDMPSTENPSIHVGEIYTVLVPPPTPK